MYGDFSKPSFIAPLFSSGACKPPDKKDGANHAPNAATYSGLLVEQGRPLTDADFNEQAALLKREIREIARATIGWHGSPDCGFQVTLKDTTKPSYSLLGGTYFVDGLRCTNDSTCMLPDPGTPQDGKSILFYLEAFDATEPPRDAASTVEPALSGIRTSVRTFVDWAVRVKTIAGAAKDKPQVDTPDNFLGVLGRADRAKRTLSVSTIADSSVAEKACASQPTDRATSDNVLYRVEIHRAYSQATDDKTSSYTFKWSRANGADTWPVNISSSNDVSLNVGATGGVTPNPLRQNDCVELVLPDQRATRGESSLFRIGALQNDGGITLTSVRVNRPTQVALESTQTGDPVPIDRVVAQRRQMNDTAYLRRWNHMDGVNPAAMNKGFTDSKNRRITPPAVNNDGALSVPSDGNWVQIENAIIVQFPGSGYEPGDYWYVRVRSDGSIYINEVPAEIQPIPALPDRHFAPLASIIEGANPTNHNERFRLFGRNASARVLGKPYPYQSLDDCSLDGAGCDRCMPGLLAPVVPTPSERPSPPAPNASPPPAETNPPTGNGMAILSSAGKLALKRYAASPTGLTRRIPARYLNHETQSAALKRWLRTALVSEIHEPTFERFFEKVMRSVAVSEIERPQIEEEAREVYGLATSLRQIVSSGGGIRELIA